MKLANVTPRPWSLFKCPCGNPVCDAYWFTNTRSDGRMSKDDAEYALKAVNERETLQECVAALASPALDFIEKVRTGRARSTDSYNKFIRALEFVNARKDAMDAGDHLTRDIIMLEALMKIASYEEGPMVGASFDEPHSAKIARAAIEQIKRISP